MSMASEKELRDLVRELMGDRQGPTDEHVAAGFEEVRRHGDGAHFSDDAIRRAVLHSVNMTTNKFDRERFWEVLARAQEPERWRHE